MVRELGESLLLIVFFNSHPGCEGDLYLIA